MRTVCKILAGCLLFGWLTLAVHAAESFHLVDGKTVSGEVIANSGNDVGLQLRLDNGQYETVPWANFSQEDLKKFKENPKYAAFVEPLIEVSAEERMKKTEVVVKQVLRLERQPNRSLLGALSTSGPGFFMLLLLYAANLFAAYEISIFRARPTALVCGVSAVLPLIGPIIFLCMPTLIEPLVEETQPQGPAVIQPFAVPTPGGARSAPAAGSGAETAESGGGGLRLTQQEAASSAIPETQVFQRGAFTFNRRFFENKFPGFFGVIKRDADKAMVLVIKSARGEYTAERISRIASNDLHVQVIAGSASEEVQIPFSEIQEIKLKHKDA